MKKKSLKKKKVVWKSSKASVASVTSKGMVKAKKLGGTKVTAAIKGTPYKATCTITVKAGSTPGKSPGGGSAYRAFCGCDSQTQGI